MCFPKIIILYHQNHLDQDRLDQDQDLKRNLLVSFWIVTGKHMNHIQRQLIKEAYQEGYQKALHENKYLDAIKRFFGFDTMSDITKAKRRGIARIPPIGKGSPFPEGDNPQGILKWIKLNHLPNLKDTPNDFATFAQIKMYETLIEDFEAGKIDEEQLMVGLRGLFPDLPWGDRYLPDDLDDFDFGGEYTGKDFDPDGDGPDLIP